MNTRSLTDILFFSAKQIFQISKGFLVRLSLTSYFRKLSCSYRIDILLAPLVCAKTFIQVYIVYASITYTVVSYFANIASIVNGYLNYGFEI